MTGLGHAPYALFVLDDIPVEIINQKLTAAFNARELGVAYLHLVDSADFSNAPRKRGDGNFNPGTKAPIDSSFASPLVGKTIEDVALLLKAAPEDADLDRRFFAVLRSTDEHMESITICRRGDREGQGDKVQYYPILAEVAAMELDTMEPGKWEERIEYYEGYKKDQGKPME